MITDGSSGFDYSTQRVDANRMLPEISNRLDAAEVELLCVSRVWGEIAAKIVSDKLAGRRIYRRKPVIVSFITGEERCIFEGIEASASCRTVLVLLRHFTKKGRPKKLIERHSQSIVSLMRPAE